MGRLEYSFAFRGWFPILVRVLAACVGRAQMLKDAATSLAVAGGCVR